MDNDILVKCILKRKGHDFNIIELWLQDRKTKNTTRQLCLHPMNPYAENKISLECKPKVTRHRG